MCDSHVHGGCQGCEAACNVHSESTCAKSTPAPDAQMSSNFATVPADPSAHLGTMTVTTLTVLSFVQLCLNIFTCVNI